MKKLILGLAALLALSTLPEQAAAKTDKTDPVVMKIDGKDVHASEFEYFYEKNNDPDVAEKKTFDEYVDLFINYKLKVAEAYHLGVDTTQAYKDELAGYRKQLAEPYLQIQGWPDSLLQQVHERQKWEVRASHLLLKCDEKAPQAYSDSIRDIVLDYQKQVEAGANFDTLCARYSQDPSAKQNLGDLGYFTAMQMVYPFEKAAFTTPIGQTTVVRTRFGWHLLKVIDKRKSLGEVMVAHIMKNLPRITTEEASKKAHHEIDSIYAALKGGANWNKACASCSDDRYTAQKGGIYPWINSAARFPKEWIDQAFALKNIGDMSEPFSTSFGWHILKLINKRAEAPADSAADVQLKEQLSKDPERMKEGEQAFVAQYRTRLAQDKKLAKEAANWSDEEVMAWADSHLEDDNLDFRNLSREYHDGLMLFDVSSKAVWDKASQDSVGQEHYFEANRTKYNFDKPRFRGAFIECVDNDSVYNALKNIYDHNADAIKAADEVRATVLKDTLLTPNPKAPRFHIVNGLFKPGDNACVDVERLHVDGVTFTPKEKMPRTMTYGRILTAPDDISDVRGSVVADYQTELENQWVAQLRQKYSVKINKKELEKLRK